ncbi:hypothetical protein EDD99_5297 [Streptomyces sp. 846.5]|nr:DUF6348 family protein [Streptomyces sp. 846.5]TDU06729.1 hypothetical protein EDD99_5297 [Streptomyces sp. 846.5]
MRRLQVIQRSVVREMACLGREFQAEEGIVRGPGTTAVAVREHVGQGGGHVDLGYVLRIGEGGGPVVWDCAAGLGRTEEEQLQNAVRMWRTTTASAVVEMLERRGVHGDHVAPGAAGGVAGWHAVQGPACVFGFRSGPLGDWVAEHQLLPAVAEVVLPHLNDPVLNGVKFFFGGRSGDEVAEVRVNGEPVAEASAALRRLSWPRGERLAWARCFVLLAADPLSLRGAEGGAEPAGAAVDGRRAAAGALLRRWRER